MSGNRREIPFTGEHFAFFCESMVGQPYWYGTCVYPCTQSRLTGKAAQYPSHYTEERMSRYRKDIAEKKVCADCVGGVKGYMWTGGGQGVREAIGTGKSYASSYASNGCPDRSANGMFDFARAQGAKWGTIDTMPEIIGLAVRMDGHVGYYVGNGTVVEWRGFAYGCVRTALKERPWTHWYELPFLDYSEEEKKEKGWVVVIREGSWNVRSGAGTEHTRIASAHGGDRLECAFQIPGDGWVQVRLADGKTGWISLKGVEGLIYE